MEELLKEFIEVLSEAVAEALLTKIDNLLKEKRKDDHEDGPE